MNQDIQNSEPTYSQHHDGEHLVTEVSICWGDQILFNRCLRHGLSLSVGEVEQGAGEWFHVPASKIGLTHWPIIKSNNGVAVVTVPETARGELILSPGDGAESTAHSLAQVREWGTASLEVTGAWELELRPEYSLSMVFGDMSFHVRRTWAAERIPRAAALDWGTVGYFGASFLGVGSVLSALAFFVPPLGLTAGEGTSRDDLIFMQQLLQASAEREREQQESSAPEPSPTSLGELGQQAAGGSGAMGKPEKARTRNKLGVQGPATNPDPHLARMSAIDEARSFGAIGLLSSLAGDPNAPTAPWGRESALGTDPQSAIGNFWGDDIGESGGSGGLGLTGAAEGGGSIYAGVGLGHVGTIGTGFGGPPGGFGTSHGRIGGSHRQRVPRVRMADTVVSGRLPKEVIQRVVRQNYGRFRLCYEKGLTQNPNLQGRVTSRFVIGRDGGVSAVSNGGSSLPDAGVVNCVVRAFYGLNFPKPEGGLVTVSYPISFSPE